MNFFYFFDKIATKFLLKLIRLYQKTISPDSGWFKDRYPVGYCKFQPHCSEYAYQAISKYGSIKGTVMAIWRLLRCHPWSKGGYDPVK